MRVLIVGTTLEGFILAYWLQQVGIEPVMVEQTKQFQAVSYPLGLQPKTIELLTQIDFLDSKLLESRTIAARQSPQALLLNEAGTVIPKPNFPFYDQDPLCLTVNQARLHTALYHGMQDRVDICFGKAVSTIIQLEEEVAVHFSDDQIELFDIVIGADGVSSSVRQLAFGNEVAHTSDLATMAFMLDKDCCPDFEPMSYHITTPQVTAFVGYFQCGIGGVFFFQAPTDCTIAPQDRKSFLLNLCQGNYHILESVINQLPDETPIFYDDVWEVNLPQWSTGRVALLGSAVHYPLAQVDQGSRLAVCGAYTLAQALNISEDYTDAWADYETTMREYPEMVMAE